VVGEPLDTREIKKGCYVTSVKGTMRAGIVSKESSNGHVYVAWLIGSSPEGEVSYYLEHIARKELVILSSPGPELQKLRGKVL
jgi:hypothetical protein